MAHSAPTHPSIIATIPTREAVEKDSCQTNELLPKFHRLHMPTQIKNNNMSVRRPSIVGSLPIALAVYRRLK